MSKKMVLVPNGEAVFAVPVEVCEQYALEGDALAAAKTALEGETDVEGQYYSRHRENSRGESWGYNRDSRSWERTPWFD